MATYLFTKRGIYYFERRVLIFMFAIIVAFFNFVYSPAIAQTSCYADNYIKIYQEVISGQKQLSQLSQQEKQCVMTIVQILSRSSAPKKTDECQYAWDSANSAADDVVSYSNRLIRCVENGDHSDDCYSEARRVRSSHSDYETAVSEVQYYCN